MAVLACTPHPGLGHVSVTRGRIVHVVDLATCRETTHRAPPRRFVVPGLTTRGQSLAYGGRTLFTERRAGNPLIPLGLSPDRRCALFAIDRFGSLSILLDGLPPHVVSTRGGRLHTLPLMLLRDGYRTWCGGKLVLTAGGDRIAWHGKRLVVTSAPDWKPRLLVRARGRSFGASTCAPDGRSVVVQSQRDSTNANFWSGAWTLWRVGLDGHAAQLTYPPKGYVDESPRYAADGTLFFVRSRRGHGRLFALRHGHLSGPLLSLGYRLGYYGAQDWPYAVSR
jgi:hypothetical protein